MNKFILAATLMMSLGLVGSLAFGNPAMLPKHPGYPMDNAKDPVTGMSLANDPGEKQLSVQESLKQAAKEYGAESINTATVPEPSVVPVGRGGSSTSAPQNREEE